jgi:5-methyltetrahydrofolate--homocysteine methyltransferase
MFGEIRQRSGGAGSVIGLSNISFGLPARKLLNRTFLAMAAAAGLTAAILDPLDPEIMGTFYAAGALTLQDEYCMKYITAHRKGKL